MLRHDQRGHLTLVGVVLLVIGFFLFLIGIGSIIMLLGDTGAPLGAGLLGVLWGAILALVGLVWMWVVWNTGKD